MPWWRSRCPLRASIGTWWCARRPLLAAIGICASASLFASWLLCSIHASFLSAPSLAGRPGSGSDPEQVRARGVTLYVVTPTYRRPTQAPDLVRVSQALLLARAHIFWVVVEDAYQPTELVQGIRRRSGLAGVHLVARTPAEYRSVKHGKGATQRIKALAWLRDNATLPGVLYFADDDNAYDYTLFSQMTRIRRVGVFPVGLIGRLGLSSPVVSAQGRVVGFHDSFLASRRRFPVDMAGFAVNLQLIISIKDLQMPHKKGMLETEFLSSLGVDRDDLEPLASNCTEVLVWHTKTVSGIFPSMKSVLGRKEFLNTNIPALYKNALAE